MVPGALPFDESKIKKIEEGIYTCVDGAGAAYDNKAKMYERLVSSRIYNRIMWGTSPDDYTAFAATALGAQAGLTLDLGCGGLTHTADLYAKTERVLILVDHSLAMLRIAQERLRRKIGAVPERVRFLQADAFALPFPAECFDAVCSFGMLHLFNNRQDLIAEALRVLKRGGRFYFSSLTADRPFSKRVIQSLQGEFGAPFTSAETLALFDARVVAVEHFTRGSMVFVSGEKR